MKKRSYFLNTCLALMVCSTSAISSPVSIEYINSRIKEATDEVLLQCTQENNRVESKVNAIPIVSLEDINSQIKDAADGVLLQCAQADNKIESKINEIPIVNLHQIGESYQGGIIFWVDETKQHGLIVAKIDANQGIGIGWQNGESGDKITNARGNGLYAGASNTHLIVSQQTIDDQEGNFAALSAQNFSVQSDGVSPCNNDELCYGNWYLPSINELQLLRINLYDKEVGGFSESAYWSSTEVNVNQALTINWASSESILSDKSSTEPKVRAIHAF